MGTLERTVTYKHEIGPAGKLTMKGVTGHLHVTGVDGDEARLRVVYRVRASDQATAERALDQGRVKVERGPDSLVVETPERRLSVGIAWLFGGSRVSVDLFAEVPFATRVNLETVSGSVDAAHLSGEQRYRTISGEIRLTGVGDTVSASTVSGAVYAEGLAGVRLNLQTVSGSVTARAPLFRDLRLSTTSGNLRVEGALAPGGSYKADSVSGLLELMTPSGVAAELKTLSGRINSEVEHRIQGGRGQWRAIVGDGSAEFRFNSTSGDLRIRRPMDAFRPRDAERTAAGQPEREPDDRPKHRSTFAFGAIAWRDGAGETADGTAPTAPVAASEPAAETAATAATTTTAAPAADGGLAAYAAVPTAATDRSGDAAAGTGTPTAQAEGTETEATADSSMPDDWQPEASDTKSALDRDARRNGGTEPSASGATADAQAELDVLRAVERGELTVEEAATKLEQLKEASRVR